MIFEEFKKLFRKENDFLGIKKIISKKHILVKIVKDFDLMEHCR